MVAGQIIPSKVTAVTASAEKSRHIRRLEHPIGHFADSLERASLLLRHGEKFKAAVQAPGVTDNRTQFEKIRRRGQGQLD